MSSGSSETFFFHKGGGWDCGLKTLLVQVQLTNNEKKEEKKETISLYGKQREGRDWGEILQIDYIYLKFITLFWWNNENVPVFSEITSIITCHLKKKNNYHDKPSQMTFLLKSTFPKSFRLTFVRDHFTLQLIPTLNKVIYPLH